jgi:DNA polymerase alpha subunit B
LYGNVLASGKPANLVTPFSKRTNRFAVKFSINTIPDVENEKQELNRENEEDDEYSIVSKVVNRKRCSLVIHGSGPKPGCRFMYDRTEDRVCDF